MFLLPWLLKSQNGKHFLEIDSKMRFREEGILGAFQLLLVIDREERTKGWGVTRFPCSQLQLSKKYQKKQCPQSNDKRGGNFLLISDVPHLGVSCVELNHVVNKLEMPRNMRATLQTHTCMKEKLNEVCRLKKEIAIS